MVSPVCHPAEDDSFAPHYHRVCRDLDLRIRSGTWLPGDSIPSEAALCAHHGVSRGTVERAVRERVEQGRLRRELGRAACASSPELGGSVLASCEQSVKLPRDPGARLLRCECLEPSDEIR